MVIAATYTMGPFLERRSRTTSAIARVIRIACWLQLR
jgi:hypothetical protein